VVAGDVSFTVADVPGLIAGASEGRGLGFDFLRHIERCAAIVHVIDCATYQPGRDPITDLDVIEAELTAHGGLEDRPRLVALNKIDIPDAQQVADMASGELRDRGLQVFSISTRSGQGIHELIYAMARLITARRAGEPALPPARTIIRPKAINDRAEFSVEREGELWRVRGDKPERWVRQTDFGNAEAIGYLADRLNRIGIEDRLLELGALPGDGVAIGGANAVIFDFAPQVDIGAEILSPRGQDHRLAGDRPAAERRRQKDRAYHAPDDQDEAPDRDPSTGSADPVTSSEGVKPGSDDDA
jgi:GTPase